MGAKNGGGKRKKKRKNAGERESRDDQELSGELSGRYGTVRYGTVRDGTAVAELPDLIDWPNNNHRSCRIVSVQSVFSSSSFSLSLSNPHGARHSAGSSQEPPFQGSGYVLRLSADESNSPPDLPVLSVHAAALFSVCTVRLECRSQQS